RPQNSFILYRKANQDEFEGSGLAQSAISKILGARWRLEPGEVKEVWNAKADMEALQHKRLHPDYKYQPK
ncbi:high mobility group box domain-containing protein, partial [Epithele typhae]|uniref:high mobility group box domain-containing protein n=1 Tax=Epithele typhae TaxID=378194 RepID=UPI0020083F7A